MFIPGGSAIETGGYNINNSLRLRSSASAWLNRTFSSTGNRKIWTFSAWVKRGQLGTAQMIFNGYSGSETELTNIQFNSNDTIEYYYDNNATNYRFTTSQVFRDPSAWYHIVLAVDTTQATNTNRVKLYVNGSQVTAFSLYETFPQNSDTFVNGAWGHGIGKYIYPGQTRFVDGYLAEVNFVNAQQLTPSSFGATDAVTGVWAPKAYTGTYGTNGFYLKFADASAATAAAIGKDSSGNGNNWTPNNISVTAGTTYDAMTDSPTLTSATTANYAVLNPLNKDTSITVTDGNLAASSSGTNVGVTGSIAISSGKWYWEITQTAGPVGTSNIVGITDASLAAKTAGLSANSYGYGSGSTSYKWNNATNTAYGANWTNGDIISVAFDADAGTLTFYKNNVSQGTAFTGISGTFYPAFGFQSTTAYAVNFGQRPFAYTPPTGFNRLNTFNLPTSTIVKGNTVMDATAYTGTNGSPTTQVISSNFQPDFLWFKKRSASYDHALIDTNRGINKQLYSNLTNAEGTDGDVLTAIGASSFTVGNSNYSNYGTLVAWTWKANGGTTSSNTAGSITSTVQANTTAGFSIVTFTGNGVNSTVGHGLGVAPRMIIEKERSAVSNWATYHASLGATKAVYLNLTNAEETQTAFWNSTAPTSTVFSLGTDGDTNSNGVTYVAYCFAEIAGFSRFGSYTGNGSADGPFVFTGFMPKYLMIKSSSIAGEWAIYDVPRDLYNPMGLGGGRLRANTAAAETSADSAQYIDFLSNGFKIRNTSGFDNQSGATYIYMAFASNPFKNSNAF